MKPKNNISDKNWDNNLNKILKNAGLNVNHQKQADIKYGRLGNVLHEITAPNKKEYAIVQEGKHIYLKVKNGGAYDYIGGVENIREHSYKSYADALKHLNLMFKEINEQMGLKKNINVLLEEQEKKFVLKTPDGDAESDDMADDDTETGDEFADADTTGDAMDDTMDDTADADMDLGGDMNADMGMDDEAADDPDASPVKSIQKLTGKLGNKIRNNPDAIQSDTIKYVLNSIVSAFDLSKLSDEDYEDILSAMEDNKAENPDEEDVEDVASDETGADDFEAMDDAGLDSGEEDMGDEELNENKRFKVSDIKMLLKGL
jgi:hypothetical protein